MFSDPQKNIAQLGIVDGMKVVDLGAGSGFYAIESARLAGPQGRIFAVDLDIDILTKLKNSAALAGLYNVEVVEGLADKIGGTKLREAIGDRVILSNILFQIAPANRDNLGLEVKRIIKPGGKLLVVDWDESSDLAPRGSVSSVVAEGIFEKVGFKIEKKFDAGDHHYGIIFKRA